MIPQKALDLAKRISGVLVLGDPEAQISAISIDSRGPAAGALFIPIKGAVFDGHDFIDEALSQGAVGFITENWDEELRLKASEHDGCLVIKVSDSLTALQRLAAGTRALSGAKVIGVTGSTGKTGTKNMLDSILAKHLKVVSTPKNFNNEIGVPLTLLQANVEVDTFIIEMGMRGLGQIAALCDIARPDIGVITNIGDSHVGVVGSRELVAQAKGELMASLSSEGFAVLNADDPWTEKLAAMTNATVVTYGLTPKADIYASSIHLDRQAKAHFVIHAPGEKYSVSLSIPGKHTIHNALAAAAAASCLGICSLVIADGLATAGSGDMRFSVSPNSEGVIVINDSYNANPASMRAALETVAAIEDVGRRVAVLGDMAELGELSQEAHFEIGQLAARLKIDMLVTVGENVKSLNEGAISGGMDNKMIWTFSSKEAALEHLHRVVKANDLVLVKASRFMEFEYIADRLQEKKIN